MNRVLRFGSSVLVAFLAFAAVGAAAELQMRPGPRAVVRDKGYDEPAYVARYRAERERQGLSLADINERTGIDRAALSRLENNEDANPTLTTLERYAEAVGKQMVVFLSETPS